MSDGLNASTRSPGRGLAAWRVNLKCTEWKQVQQLAELHGANGYIVLNALQVPALGRAVEIHLQLPDGRTFPLDGAVSKILTPPTSPTEKQKVAVKLSAQHEQELRRLSTTGKAPSTIRPAGTVAPAVGIDFGTSYTGISVAVGDRVRMIPDQTGRTVIPSVVAFPENEPLRVGWQARPMLIEDPRRAVVSAKRLLGRKFSDPTVAGFLQMAPYRTHQGINDSIVVEIDGQQRSIVEICAAVISQAREIAERYLGTEVTQAVFTIPVGFNAAQRDAVQRAATLAHLAVIDLMEEPVAAALAYGIGQKKNEIVAVYDFGGGTFDFSLLDFVHDHFRVIGTHGDTWLGGDDFDSALAQHVADQFWRAHQIELRQRAVEWHRLLVACEWVKRKLSSAMTAELQVEGVVDSPQRIDIRQTVSREELEGLCQELVERSLAVCREGLDAAKLGPEDVTEVVLSGGVACIPMVRKAVSELFQREVTQTVDSDHAVALGAGLHAARRVNHPVVEVAQSDRLGI